MILGVKLNGKFHCEIEAIADRQQKTQKQRSANLRQGSWPQVYCSHYLWSCTQFFLYKLALSYYSKTCVINSWIRVVNRISTKIEWFVASETSHPSKNFVRTCQQLRELTALYAEFFHVRQWQKPSIIPVSGYKSGADFQNLMMTSFSKR